MEEQEFTQLRDALAPDQDATRRQGALFVLDMSLAPDEGDSRMLGLLSTLLGDRDAALAAAVAGMVLKRGPLAARLERELKRAWGMRRAGYRQHLLAALEPQAMLELAMDFAGDADKALRLALLAKLRKVGEHDKALDAMLFLSMDDEAEVRSRAMRALAELDSPARRAAALRLKSDAVAEVRQAAAHALATLSSEDEAIRELEAMQADEDFDVRGSVAEALGKVRRRRNLATVERFLEEQRAAIADGNYERAIGIASQVFLKVPSHPACQYQMARACVGMGDERRAMRLLANAFAQGYGSRSAVLEDEFLSRLQSVPAWDELMQGCPAD